MGVYIQVERKRDWLLTHATATYTKDQVKDLTWKDFLSDAEVAGEPVLPVVWVNNGAFAALGVLYSLPEFLRWFDGCDHDLRPMLVGTVPTRIIEQHVKLPALNGATDA